MVAVVVVAAAAANLRGKRRGKVRGSGGKGGSKGSNGKGMQRGDSGKRFTCEGSCEGLEGAGVREEVQAGVEDVGFAATGFYTGPGPRHAAPAEQPIWALLAALRACVADLHKARAWAHRAGGPAQAAPPEQHHLCSPLQLCGGISAATSPTRSDPQLAISRPQLDISS